MSKTSQKIDELTQNVEQLTQALEKEKKANFSLREMCFRSAAQNARKRHNKTANEYFRNRFKWLIFNDFRETAIAIFNVKNIPENFRNMLNSRQIQRQVFDFGSVFLFSENAQIRNDPNDNKIQHERMPLLLPFTAVGGCMTPYGGSFAVRPYLANGGAGSFNSPFGIKIVNVDGAIISDFFEYSQSNANTSLCIKEAVEVYSEIIADIEVAKKINRNFLKVPFVISADEMTDQREIRAMLTDISTLIEGVDEGADAILTKYAKNITLLNTAVQYHGEELIWEQKEAINALYNYLGISHIKNENKARKITAEFEQISDEYNINITKRLRLQQMGFDNYAKIDPAWKNVKIEVDLKAYKEATEMIEKYSEELPQDNDEGGRR